MGRVQQQPSGRVRMSLPGLQPHITPRRGAPSGGDNCRIFPVEDTAKVKHNSEKLVAQGLLSRQCFKCGQRENGSIFNESEGRRLREQKSTGCDFKMKAIKASLAQTADWAVMIIKG